MQLARAGGVIGLTGSDIVEELNCPNGHGVMRKRFSTLEIGVFILVAQVAVLPLTLVFKYFIGVESFFLVLALEAIFLTPAFILLGRASQVHCPICKYEPESAQ